MDAWFQEGLNSGDEEVIPASRQLYLIQRLLDLNCEVKWFHFADSPTGRRYEMPTRKYFAPKVSDSAGIGDWP